MEDHEWMYTGRLRRNDVTPEWIRKTDAFVERAYDEAAKGASLVPCPCSKCDNRKRKPKKTMVEHIWKNGFTSGYTRWIFHGEAHRTREEVLRQRVEDYDADAGVADILNDYQEAEYTGGCMDDEPEPTAKAFYDMFDAAQKPLHSQTKVSQQKPPQVTRQTHSNLGTVKIRQDSTLPGTMSISWPNRPHKCIISHTRVKRKNILKVGMLCTLPEFGSLPSVFLQH